MVHISNLVCYAILKADLGQNDVKEFVGTFITNKVCAMGIWAWFIGNAALVCRFMVKFYGLLSFHFTGL
jgi:hypothetical protein